MSPIALADARTTIRGFRFCSAVVAVLLVSVFAVAQIRFATEDFEPSDPHFTTGAPSCNSGDFRACDPGSGFRLTLCGWQVDWRHLDSGLRKARFLPVCR